MIKDYADLAVVQQHAASGSAPLSAAPQGIGAFGLSAPWSMGAVGINRPRSADLGLQAKCAVDLVAPTATKPGDTTIRSNYNHMTRTVANNSDGGSGPHPPLRERPPA